MNLHFGQKVYARFIIRQLFLLFFILFIYFINSFIIVSIRQLFLLFIILFRYLFIYFIVVFIRQLWLKCRPRKLTYRSQSYDHSLTLYNATYVYITYLLYVYYAYLLYVA
jgi:hypothetical protein